MFSKLMFQIKKKLFADFAVRVPNAAKEWHVTRTNGELHLTPIFSQGVERNNQITLLVTRPWPKVS